MPHANFALCTVHGFRSSFENRNKTSKEQDDGNNELYNAAYYSHFETDQDIRYVSLARELQLGEQRKGI